MQALEHRQSTTRWSIHGPANRPSGSQPQTCSTGSSRRAWDTGEPGVIFLDHINAANPTPRLGEIEATNPCGEQPLLPHESCTLGSIDVSKFVLQTRTRPTVDCQRLAATIALAVRFLDNVIDRNHYPLAEIETATLRTRKIGLGIMGFADLLIALHIPYDSEAAIDQATSLMAFVQSQAHHASHQLGLQRGLFPAYRGSRLQAQHDRRRNATVTTIAPTGTISLIAGCSPGIEPLYGVQVNRRALEGLMLTMLHPVLCTDGPYTRSRPRETPVRSLGQSLDSTCVAYSRTDPAALRHCT